MADPGEGLPHSPRRRQVNLPKGALTLWTPAGADALLDHLAAQAPDPDDKMPYWADLWPSAIALAEAIEQGLVPVRDRSVLELGAGLGLASLTAARSGGRVTATDWDKDALRYIAASAAENGLAVDVAPLDWRSPPAHLLPTNGSTILAADVLYEARNVGDVLHALRRLVPENGEAWLTDPGREHLPAFVRQAADFTFGHREFTVHDPKTGPQLIQLLRLRRRTA